MNYNDVSPEFTQKFFELVKKANRIVITAHRSPDDDAYSSTLALYDIIKTELPDKDVRLILETQPENRYKSFKGFDKIEFTEDLTTQVGEDDLLIMLDGGQFHRFTLRPEKLAKTKTTICMDHHGSPPDGFTLSLIAPQYPAAAEVVYRTFCANKEISKDLAALFLMGILDDTGNFAYLRPSQLGTFDIAKALMERIGKNIQDFQATYNTIPSKKFEVQQELLKNATLSKAAGWPDFQYSFVSENFVKAGGYADTEISGGLYTSNYLLGVTGFSWGFVITPKSSGLYISCRSLPGSVNVRELMERMQLGGGHDRAAGGTIKGVTVEQAVAQVKDWLSKNKPTLS